MPCSIHASLLPLLLPTAALLSLLPGLPRRCEMERAAADQMEADYNRAYAEFSMKHAQSAPLVQTLKQVGGWVGGCVAGSGRAGGRGGGGGDLLEGLGVLSGPAAAVAAAGRWLALSLLPPGWLCMLVLVVAVLMRGLPALFCPCLPICSACPSCPRRPRRRRLP